MIPQDFLGNRIGVFAMQVAMTEAFKMKLSIEEADAIFGRPMGIPKTGVFGLYGGDTTIDKTLTEDDLYKLELDAFMRLIETKETQDRIKHTLATGKPLVN